VADDGKLLFIFFQCSYEPLAFFLLIFELLNNKAILYNLFFFSFFCFLLSWQAFDLQLFQAGSSENSDTDLKQSNSVLIQGTDDLSAAGAQALREGQRSGGDSTAA